MAWYKCRIEYGSGVGDWKVKEIPTESLGVAKELFEQDVIAYQDFQHYRGIEVIKLDKPPFDVLRQELEYARRYFFHLEKQMKRFYPTKNKRRKRWTR